jgi:hypothetical protein
MSAAKNTVFGNTTLKVERETPEWRDGSLHNAVFGFQRFLRPNEAA